MSEPSKDKAGEQGSLLHRAVQKIENVFDGLKKDLQEAREQARGGEPSTTQQQQQQQSLQSQPQQQSHSEKQQQQQQATHPSDSSSSSSSSSSHHSSSKTWHWKGLDEEPPKPLGNPGWQGQQTETGHGGYGSGSSPKHATTEEMNANSNTRPQAMDLHGQERGGGAGLGSPYTTGAPISSTTGSAVAPKLLDTPSSFAAERDFSANLSEYAKQQHIGSRFHHTDSTSSTQSTQATQSSSGAQSSVMVGSSQSTRPSLSQSASSASSASTGVAQAGQSEQAPVESGFGGTIDNSSWRAGVAGSTSQLSSGPDYGDLKSPKNNPEKQE